MRFIGIIPARYASTRFPGKPLAMIGGMTMIERVYRRVSEVLDQVAVATDDRRIYDAVTAFGGTAVMTSQAHRSGTDRCLEAYDTLGCEADVVINIQGDEPFIDPSQIRLLMSCFDDESTEIATLVRRVDPSAPYGVLDDPNTPKVVVDDRGRALYFSRSVIPYVRSHPRDEWARVHGYLTHVGIYAFRTGVLRRVVALPQSPLELAESLEQLRWLQGGYKIQTALTDCATIGIDTPADLERANRMLAEPDRTVAPPLSPVGAVHMPPESVETLPNGVVLHVCDGGAQPMARVAVFTSGGTADSDDPAAVHVASLAMRESTASYAPGEIDDLVDYNGARLGGNAKSHFVSVNLLALGDKLPVLLPAVRSILTEADFRPELLEPIARRLASMRQLQQSKVSVMATNALSHMLQGDTPAARVVTAGEFASVTRGAALQQYAGSQDAVRHVFVGGGLGGGVLELVREFASSLPAAAVDRTRIVADRPSEPGRVTLTREGALQAAVAAGVPAPGRSSADYVPLRLAVMALGGYFGSRLMQNIRERQGLTYGIGASLLGSPEGSFVQVTAQCDGSSVGRVLDGIRAEMTALRTDPPRGDELQRLRMHAWTQLASSADSWVGIMEHYITRLCVNTPDGYFNTQLEAIAALTPEMIAAMAERYLDPAALRVAVVTAP